MSKNEIFSGFGGLNSQQKQAAEAHTDQPLLIVAGAGTGKTRTLTSRIIYLLNRGVRGDQICAITFTNKAAREMRERIEKALAGAPIKKEEHPYLGTFHALGAQILRKECRAAGRTPNFAIFDDHDSLQLLKRILKGFDLPKGSDGPAWFSQKIGAIKNGEVSTNSLENSSRRADQLLLQAYEEYERRLEQQNAFDFDDLIQKPVRIFRTQPEILQKYRRRYQYLLVDEYQDLNNSQYEMIRLIAGDSQRLSVVGDDQQTIYSWRGSNFEIFLNFERDWPQSQVVLLEENYRSAGNILRAAGAVIQNNQKQKQKTLWTRNPEGEKILLLEAGDEDEEAEWAAVEIEEAKRAAPELSIAILYRTNAQSRAIEQALLRHRLPYLVFGGLKFYERREVKDLVAGLRYIANPKDEVSRERLEKTFSKTRFREFQAALPGHAGEKPLELMQFVLTQFDYHTYILKNLTNPEERRENIGELGYFAAQFEDLPQMLEQIALLQATDTLKETSGRPVQLMTIHLAKGLEFDEVFLVGCTEGLLPHVRSLESEAQLEEERRLMYVAMTRARQKLRLSFYEQPSRFLSELPDAVLSFRSLTTNERYFKDDEDRYISWD